MHIFSLLSGMHFVGGVLIPFFTDWGKIDFAQIMLLQSVFAISIVIFEVPTGAIADRFGRKASIFLGAIFNILAMLLYSMYPDFLLFAIAEMLWAFGGALISGANEAIVYDSLKASGKAHMSKRILGRFNAFHLTGIMIAGPIGSTIAFFLGTRYTMLFSVFPFIAAAVLALSINEPYVFDVPKRKYTKLVVEGFRYLKQHKIIRMLAFDAIAIQTASFMIIWLYQPLLGNLGVSIAFFGVVHAAIAGMESIIMNRYTELENLSGSKKSYLLLSALITGVSFIALGFSSIMQLSVILIVVAAGLGLTRYALISNYMNKYIGSESRATVLSTVSMLTRLAQAAAYPLVGILVSFSLSAAFVVLGIVMIAIALISGIKEEHLID